MFSLTAIFFCIIALYGVAFIALGTTKMGFRTLPNISEEIELSRNLDAQIPTQIGYKFNNPRVAYEVLRQLDVFKPVADTFWTPKPKYDEVFLGMRNDDEYCDKHRAYIVSYPETIFEEINFVTDYGHKAIVRSKAAQVVGNDIQPDVSAVMSKKERESGKHTLQPYANLILTSTPTINTKKHLGKHFSCLSQESNHIPGNDILSRKNRVAKATIEYAKQFEDRPHCFNYEKFFPKTWILYEKNDCEDFFNALNSPEYQQMKEKRRIVYIRKVGAGSHRGEGVQPVNEEEEADLRKTYDNGKKCGKVAQNYLIQNYVHNPLLLDGHKFDFRMYMLLASTNPMIAYYHDGFLRVNLASYDLSSNEKKVFLTNLSLNKQIYSDAKDGNLYEGMDEEQLKLAQQWSFDRLQAYLFENGIVTDPNWLDNYLRPEFKKAMIHLLRLSSHSFLKKSSLYELYGVDFMLDTDLNLWFVEANAGPALNGYSEPMEKFVTKMLQDSIKLTMGLLRSRMKRVVEYVNELLEEGEVEETYKGHIEIKDLEAKREIFDEITKNSFEKEFEPSEDNGFVKILDDNYEDIDRYQGLVPIECF